MAAITRENFTLVGVLLLLEADRAHQSIRHWYRAKNDSSQADKNRDFMCLNFTEGKNTSSYKFWTIIQMSDYVNPSIPEDNVSVIYM